MQQEEALALSPLAGCSLELLPCGIVQSPARVCGEHVCMRGGRGMESVLPAWRNCWCGKGVSSSVTNRLSAPAPVGKEIAPPRHARLSPRLSQLGLVATGLVVQALQHQRRGRGDAAPRR